MRYLMESGAGARGHVCAGAMWSMRVVAPRTVVGVHCYLQCGSSAALMGLVAFGGALPCCVASICSPGVVGRRAQIFGPGAKE